MILFNSGMKQVISIKIKSEKDLEAFKKLEFTNVIKMSEVKIE